MVDVRSARVRPTRRRNLRLVEAAVADAQRADEGGLVQPGLPRRAPAARGRGCCSTASSTARGFRVATHEIVAGRRRRRPVGHAHDRDRPGPQRDPRALGEAAARVGLAGDRPRRRRDRAAAGRAARAPRGSAAEADALRCAHFPESPRAGRARRATELALRGAAACTRWRSRARRAARRDSRPGIAIEPGGRAGRRAGSRSLPFELTADQRARVRRDRRRPRRGPADAAAADGRRRLGQDGRSPSTRCCARSRPAIRRR